MTANIRMRDDGQHAIAPGSFVYSKRGRDSGRVFIVTGVCEPGCVLIVDGKLRKVEKPKKKKLKHVLYAGGEYAGYGTLTNRKSDAAIKQFCASVEGIIKDRVCFSKQNRPHEESDCSAKR